MSPVGPVSYFLVSDQACFALLRGEYVIGREPDADFAFCDDLLLSRRHARLVIGFDSVEVEDLGSLNGTRVDGELVQHRLRVRPGATVRFGAQSFKLHQAQVPTRAQHDTLPDSPSARPGRTSSTEVSTRPDPAPESKRLDAMRSRELEACKKDTA